MAKNSLRDKLEGDELDLSMMSLTEVPVKEIVSRTKPSRRFFCRVWSEDSSWLPFSGASCWPASRVTSQDYTQDSVIPGERRKKHFGHLPVERYKMF